MAVNVKQYILQYCYITFFAILISSYNITIGHFSTAFQIVKTFEYLSGKYAHAQDSNAYNFC